MAILENIGSPNDVKKLDAAQLDTLCAELRVAIIEETRRSGGHLASSLGAVELIVALHRVFSTPKDRIVFDVGHQAYAHKLLTGRRERFSTLRRLDGLGGFPDPRESEHDAFRVGHASTAVSAALGMARARTLKGEDSHVIALLGDGALTGGMAYEALTDAGQSRERLLVILNDNEMSISQNAGGVERLLGRLRLRPGYMRAKGRVRSLTSRGKFGRGVYHIVHRTKQFAKSLLIRSNIFEDMGFTYLGPVDGHDVKGLVRLLELARSYDGPVLIHAVTVKGRGYAPAEKAPQDYHGISPQDAPKTGKSYSKAFGDALCELARADSRICAITAAMQSGTGLERFATEFPNRFFDVGIAEEHAATMAAGLCAAGMKPVFAVYSTFAQRCYDQMLHDVALQGLPVVFAFDRAGLVGEDGATHHGVFDPGFVAQMPGVRMLAPAGLDELKAYLADALDCGRPCVVRYPRGGEGRWQGVSRGACEVVREGSDVAIAAYGHMLTNVLDAADMLEKQGISAEIVKINELSPLDCEPIFASARKCGRLVVAEDCVEVGSVGQRLAASAMTAGERFGLRLVNLGEQFCEHGKLAELERRYHIDAASIAEVAAWQN